MELKLNGKIKLELINIGGEFAFGLLTDKEKIDLCEKLIEEDNLCIENYSNDKELMFFETDEELFHVYGPSYDNNVDINIYKCKEKKEDDEDDEECENSEIIFEDNLDNTKINVFTSQNLYFNSALLAEKEKKCLQFGGYTIEKNIYFPVVINIPKNENFKFENVYIGTTNMDETLSNDEIITNVYYINETNKNKICKLYDIDNEKFYSYIEEIFENLEETNNENFKQIKNIFNECLCEILDIESYNSKGSHVTVLDLNYKVLYNKNC